MAMSDGINEFLDGKEAGTPAPGSEETPATDKTVDTSDESADDPLPDQDTFDRAYVEKLRKESASYRQRAKKYEEAFQGVHEEDQQVWLTLVNNFKADPGKAAEQMATIASEVRKQYGDEAGDKVEAAAEKAAEQAESEEDRPLTRKEYEEMRKKEQEQSEVKAEVARINAKATELGYEIGSEDYQLLLITAQRQGGDLQKAHDKIEARKQEIIDNFVKEREQDAKGPKTSTGEGAPPSGERSITNLKDAKAAMINFLDAQKGS